MKSIPAIVVFKHLILITHCKLSTPSTRMCKWFKVVIEAVRFLLAKSNCLMSLVISLTVSSDCSALSFMSFMCTNSCLMTFCASSKAALPSFPTLVCPLTTERISLSMQQILNSILLTTSSMLDNDCSVGNRLLM